MKMSGHLVPFPDSGAADMMSDYLEQVVEAVGPGRLVCRISPPPILGNPASNSTPSQKAFASTRLEVSVQNGSEWTPLGSSDSDSAEAVEEVTWEVETSCILKCKLMNISSIQGQFTLECDFFQKCQ
jgi:hypothetical protein